MAKRKSEVRAKGARRRVQNSGLEVWLYDDANRQQIRDSGAVDFTREGSAKDFRRLARDGAFVGYSLDTDDEVDVAVHVGEPLTDDEMSVARWLEPQTAFLRLPSGKLCVESNDASRIGPGEPGEKGASVSVPRGDYRLTLYRIDREALQREGLTWNGPREVIVLTPGGNSTDATEDLLPYELRRDTSWVGRYEIHGKHADALVWFSNPLDTFLLNLDSAAAEKLPLVPGSYLRTSVPSVGITVVSAYDKSWADAQRLPEPPGHALEEYGFGALCPMNEDWNGAEGLLSRRERAETRVADRYLNLWLPAHVEVLDEQPARVARVFTASELATKTDYYSEAFFSVVLSEVIPQAADMDELPLPKALGMLDKKFGKTGLAPQGDASWEEKLRGKRQEATCRLYTGLDDTFGAVLASAGWFEILFISELGDGNWIVTGFADEIESQMPNRSPGVQLRSIDDDLAKIFTVHQASLRAAKQAPLPAPVELNAATAAFGRFLSAVFD